MRLLLIGGRGQVGYELRRALSPVAEVITTVSAAPARGELQLDLCDPRAVRDTVASVAPDVLVNAAAYTAVDAAETEADRAQAVNADAVALLAELAAARRALLVHYSTDYVFDGTGASGPAPAVPSAVAEPAFAPARQSTYLETDPCRPLSVYGRTKRAGEEAVLALAGAAPHLVLRTGWVYGTRGRNFSLTMQRLAAGEGPIRVVADQFGTPTWSRLIAVATGYLIAHLRAAADAGELSGLYHLCAPDHTSWHGFASHIIRRAAGCERAAQVTAIATSDYPVAAARPAWSVLHAGKLRARLGVGLPPWRTQFDCMFDELAEARTAVRA